MKKVPFKSIRQRHWRLGRLPLKKPLIWQQRSNFSVTRNIKQKYMETKLNEVEINGVKYVRKDTIVETAVPSKDYVIVRCASAGCFFGQLIETNLGNNGCVTLKNARRLWYWSGAASLSQLAVDGTSQPKDCKFPVVVPEIQLTGCIELIPCTEKAAKSISEVAVWKA